MLKRDLFSGEWVEEPSTGGRQILARETVKPRGSGRHNSVWSTPWRSKALGASNPDQIPEINEAMKAQGVGAYIDPRTNELVCETRGQRNRALQFFNKIDYDGGYGDVTSHSRPFRL